MSESQSAGFDPTTVLAAPYASPESDFRSAQQDPQRRGRRRRPTAPNAQADTDVETNFEGPEHQLDSVG